MERLIAQVALESEEIKRLMTVPGVNVIVAASFLAAIGDVHRFAKPAQAGRLPGPRSPGLAVRQRSRLAWAHLKAGLESRHATPWWRRAGAPCDQPGPIKAFYERIRARRGYHVAIVACARKLACLFWCLLTREEDYAFAQPSLTKKKLRRLEITAGAERYTQSGAGIWVANDAVRQAERELARQAELAYARTVRDWHAVQASKEGASVTKGRASNTPSKGKAARQTKGP